MPIVAYLVRSRLEGEEEPPALLGVPGQIYSGTGGADLGPTEALWTGEDAGGGTVDTDLADGADSADRGSGYRGYSLAACSFLTALDLAVGAPRAEGLLGQAHLLSVGGADGRQRMTSRLLYTFTGEQPGAYFGHSLAAADADGDGLDDLLAVGAPLFTETGGRGFEQGRVYVIIRSGKVTCRFNINLRKLIKLPDAK